MLRTIREEEPPKPSTRLSTLTKEELSAVAAQRSAPPAKLGRLVRGDLDWIVMKALEKDRRRRYETASSLARDVERHQRSEPVSAAAPSLLYRTGKFLRRHRPRTTPLQFFLLAWRNMAIAALLMGWSVCLGTSPAWYAWLLVPFVCFAGPLYAVLDYLHVVPREVLPNVGLSGCCFGLVVASLYGLSVAWLFWKPSVWSKAAFVLLSVVWLLFGCGIISIAV